LSAEVLPNRSDFRGPFDVRGVSDGEHSVMPAVDPMLLAHVAQLSARVEELVAIRRQQLAHRDSSHLGLYVSDDEAAALGQHRGNALVVSRFGSPAIQQSEDLPVGSGRLQRIAATCALDAIDVSLLVLASAVELETRFERLFGYLHDDLTRRRPSVGLALELSGFGFAEMTGRERFSTSGALVRNRLIIVDETGPALSQPFRVADRVLDYLLGSDRPDELVDRVTVASVSIVNEESEQVSASIRAGFTPVHLLEVESGAELAIGGAAIAALGLDILTVDCSEVEGHELADLCERLVREAKLQVAGLVARLPEPPVASGLESQRFASAMAVLTRADWPIVLVSKRPWNPSWSPEPVISVQTNVLSPAIRDELWRACLPGMSPGEVSEATEQYRLAPHLVIRAAQSAQARAAAGSRPLTAADIGFGVRSQNSSELERLARRCEPTVGWDSLVVPPAVLAQLKDVADRFRLGPLVHGVWGMGGANNRRRGVVGLFAGPSGVGKTLAAEATAGELAIDLYVVNLATVVDKYIGETEKNLERIFSAAEGVNGIILFDEADSLFGKRSEVNDARDRYANVEVAYLLQRLEDFAGIALLSTNLRTNIDDAFTRRIDVLIDFPEPDVEHRLLLWERCLGSGAPRADDLDLEFLAERFELTGGNIRNICVAAAFGAAAQQIPISMSLLVSNVALEYRKLGRLCNASEFGDWLDRL
jgi:hypothetical protein